MAYDFQRYDLKSGKVLEKERVAFYFVDLSVSIGSGKENSRAVSLTSDLNSSLDVNPCWNRMLFTTVGELDAIASADNCIYRTSEQVSGLEAAVDVIKDMSRNSSHQSILNIDTLLSKWFDAATVHESNCRNFVEMQFNNYRESIVSGMLGAFIETVSITKTGMQVNLTIPVGGTLVIDMDNCTAFLNGENVFDKIVGDWLNLSKDDLLLVLDNGSGAPLSGAVAFVERYL
jgi:hypothetical protein